VFGATAKLNGTTIEGGNDIQYFRESTYGQKSTTATSFAIEVDANDDLTFETFLLGTGGPATPNHKVTSTDGDDGAISITRLT
jgi:hypothetical protein